VWNLYFASHAIDDVMIYLAVGAIGGFVVALVTIFNKPISPYTSPVYAILEGFAIGAVSALYEAKRPGIALQAVGLTMGTLACMLAAYRFQIIKVTENFKMGIVAATGGIAILYIVDLVLMYFGHPGNPALAGQAPLTALSHHQSMERTAPFEALIKTAQTYLRGCVSDSEGSRVHVHDYDGRALGNLMSGTDLSSIDTRLWMH
jgi:Bax inhibitor 1 like